MEGQEGETTAGHTPVSSYAPPPPSLATSFADVGHYVV